MNKVILITGASSGIGKTTAMMLREAGNTVYATARGVNNMQELSDAGCKLLSLDVTKEEDIKAAVKEIIKQDNKVDVLINNAGFGLYGAVEDIPIDDARAQFEVNLFGMARLTQEVLPHMRKAGSGRVINISSMAGKMYTPMGAWYHASKHAVEGWSDCLRIELQQFGIDVVLIEPGIIKTNFASMTKALSRYSGKSAYAKLAKAMIKSIESSYAANGSGSEPEVVATTIDKAINSTKPKTRYITGRNARLFIYTRKSVSDRIFDKILLSRIK